MPRTSWFLLLPVFLWSCSESGSRLEGKRGDAPDAAARWNRLLRQSDDGTIPPDALMQAKLQRDQMLAAQGGVDRGGITRGTWRWMGPGRTGGRIRAIVFHPTVTTTM